MTDTKWGIQLIRKYYYFVLYAFCVWFDKKFRVICSDLTFCICILVETCQRKQNFNVYCSNINLNKIYKKALAGKYSTKIDCFQECLLQCRLRSRFNESHIVLVMMMLCISFQTFFFSYIIVHTSAIENMLQSPQDFYISLFS